MYAQLQIISAWLELIRINRLAAIISLILIVWLIIGTTLGIVVPLNRKIFKKLAIRDFEIIC